MTFNQKINIILLICISILFSACGEDSHKTVEAPEEIRKSINPVIDKLNAAIKENIEDADLYFQRGEAYKEVQGYDEAIADLEKAISLSPDTPEYYHILADYYMDYFRSRKALQTMETAGLKFSERIPTLLKLAEFYLILKEHPSAHRTLDRIKKIQPLNAEMFFMRGMVYEDEGKIPDAISALRFAVENNSDFTDAYVKLGELNAEKDSKLALQFYENALRTAPENVEVLMAKAYHLSNVMNDLKGSQEVYRAIHKLDPRNKMAWHNSGLVYMDMDSLVQAKRQFTFAIKVSPIAVESYYYRGIASEMMGDVSAARDDYEQVTRMNPSFKPAKEGLARVSAGVKQ